jgi:hypothetical protein
MPPTNPSSKLAILLTTHTIFQAVHDSHTPTSGAHKQEEGQL